MTAVPATSPKPSFWKSPLVRCFAYLRPHWRMVAGAYAFMVLIDIINLLNPQLLRSAIDRGIDGGDITHLGWMAASLLGLVLVKGLFTFFQGRWTEIASQNVAYDLRNALQRKITLLSFSFHDKAEAGDLLSRAIQDVERIRFVTGRATFRVVEGIFLLLLTAGVLIAMNPMLGLLSTAAIPILVFFAVRFGRVYRPLSWKIQAQLGVLTTRVEQNLRGARVVKTFAQEAAETARFEAENAAWTELSSRAAALDAVHMPRLHLIANLASVAILFLGGRLVMQDALTLGELVAFTTYMANLIAPVRFLGMVLPAITNAAVSAERIFEILDSIPDVREAPNAPELTVSRGQVRFERVSFSYGRGASVLSEVDFEAQPDQVVALVGPTGSGKTSITNLIPRFYDPTSGRILVDGTDIRQVSLASLRANIGMVLQESTLFAASIRENIGFGRPDATLAEIEQAARDAQAHDFITRMPKGYDTHVGERGITLSGGQKQRLAIARALLTDPRILILDDATSSVDSETEHLIQLALERVMRGRTTFVIAHRLSTVQYADLILVLDRGRVAARGRHAELMTSSELYRLIVEQQLQPAAPAEGG